MRNRQAGPFQKIFNSFIGIIIGIILLPVSLYVLYTGENLTDYASIVEKASLIEANKPSGEGTLVKFRGPIKEGDFIKSAYFDGDLLNIIEIVEEYDEEIRKDSKGRKKKRREWDDISRDEESASYITLGDIKVDLRNADIRGEMELTVMHKGRGDTDWIKGSPSSSPPIGTRRLTVKGVPAIGEFTVVGKLSGGKISDGEAFFVTPETMSELVKNLKGEQNFKYWLLKVVSFFLFWIGLNLLIGPALAILDVADDFLPFLKFATSGISAGLMFVTAVIAFAVVLITTLLIKLFWVIVALVFLGGALCVYIFITKSKS